MIKKAFIIMLLLVSMQVFPDSLLDLNGHDWLSMNEQQRIYLLAGWLIGIYTVYKFVEHEAPESVWVFNVYFPVEDISLQEFIQNIDTFYESNDLKIPLMVAIHNHAKKETVQNEKHL